VSEFVILWDRTERDRTCRSPQLHGPQRAEESSFSGKTKQTPSCLFNCNILIVESIKVQCVQWNCMIFYNLYSVELVVNPQHFIQGVSQKRRPLEINLLLLIKHNIFCSWYLKIQLIQLCFRTCVQRSWHSLYNSVINSIPLIGREPWSIGGQTHGITSRHTWRKLR
jgi:hypothetical protein